MSDQTVVSLGQINGAGSATALFLKVFGGEVIKAFNARNITRALHRVKQLASGKSAQFPATWKVTSSLHVPGTKIVGQQVNHNERVVPIDGFLVADVFVPEIDELMNHYESRAEFTRQIGEELARKWDTQVFRTIGLGARASAVITGGDGGKEITDAGFANQGNVIAAGLFECAQTFAEKNVPEEDRYAAMPPAQYYLLVQTTNVINRDWDGQGSYSKGTVPMVAGIGLWMSNNTPKEALATGPSQYQGTFTNTKVLSWHTSAAASVMLRDITGVVVDQPDNLGTLLFGKLAVGSDYLRPESCVELKSA